LFRLNKLIFFSLYGQIHKYISIVLCLLGVLTNTIHIWALSRKQMRTSSVHIVLIFIMTKMIRFNYFLDWLWALFLHIHATVSIALHALSLYLVVLMAFIRCQVMRAETSQSKWMSPQVALISASLITLATFTLSIPTFLTHQIIEVPSENSLEMKYTLSIAKTFLENNCAGIKTYLWLTGILLKVIPCVLMMSFTFGLLTKFRQNERKRNTLLYNKQSTCSLRKKNSLEEFETIKEVTHKTKCFDRAGVNKKRTAAGDRTTYMLLLMVVIFLCTELVQGVFAILNALFITQFHMFIYKNLADVLDLLSLINCYVAFLVYTTTCSRYRKLILQILRPVLPK
uniref:G_PROTEIN_RECEP_F1_2 domain-containing protein n=1 Tax=Rhabditophanes sp. KR3021 TaxID=114890 RepID=A0AC35TSP2_9BILA